jgi:DNA-binding CsgD family transcriptional regulator
MPLTLIEITVLEWMADGLTIGEIARKALVSGSTVRTHRRKIFEKLKVDNANEAISAAYRTGLLQVDGGTGTYEAGYRAGLSVASEALRSLRDGEPHA